MNWKIFYCTHRNNLHGSFTFELFLCFIDELQNEVPSLQEVLLIAKEADKCELEQSYKKALELYKVAVEKLLPVIESKTDSR